MFLAAAGSSRFFFSILLFCASCTLLQLAGDHVHVLTCYVCSTRNRVTLCPSCGALYTLYLQEVRKLSRLGS